MAELCGCRKFFRQDGSLDPFKPQYYSQNRKCVKCSTLCGFNATSVRLKNLAMLCRFSVDLFLWMLHNF